MCDHIFSFKLQIQTDFQQVTENQFVLSLAEPDKVHHIVIFLLGTVAFPEGMGGGVYFSWPGPQPAWQLLGHISNMKPSAIFKISQVCLLSIVVVHGSNLSEKTTCKLIENLNEPSVLKSGNIAPKNYFICSLMAYSGCLPLT